MEQKIKDEWEKIKDSNIFSNINEFAKLFEDNPKGSCFKKYTNYPWCKENFFFGSYNELLNFYKTSLEIPFYLEKRIGEKFGQLIIKSFLVKIINNKRKIFAKCLCECGRECEKDFNRILEGHIKTCGQHKGQKKNYLLTLFPEIIKEHWDYEKNKELPENIKITSNKEYWWADDTGSFLLKPSELTKKKFGTSFHEQCIYYYCKQLFDTTKNRYIFKINNISTETDIYIPEIKVAIEYDGVYWHKAKEKADLEKTNRLNSQNIFLIRVREKGLNIIENTITKTIICDFNDDNFNETINSVIKTIKQYLIKNDIKLEQKTNDMVHNFNLNSETFEDDKLAILNQYRTNYVNDNITKTCLIKYWDYDKNKAIIPQKVSTNDDIKVWFTCKYGFSRKINVKSICKEHFVCCENNKNCLNCNGLYCPFCSHCGRWYYRSNPCVQMIKYYYYCIFYEEQKNIDELIYFNSDSYIKHATITLPEQHEDNFYELHSIYKYHKKDLIENQKLFFKMRKIFYYDTMSMKNFNNFSEFEEYINFYDPYIEKINFKDFDINNEIRTKFLKFLPQYIISHYHNTKLLALSNENKTISEELKNGLIKILKKLCNYHKTNEYLEIIYTYENIK